MDGPRDANVRALIPGTQTSAAKGSSFAGTAPAVRKRGKGSFGGDRVFHVGRTESSMRAGAPHKDEGSVDGWVNLRRGAKVGSSETKGARGRKAVRSHRALGSTSGSGLPTGRTWKTMPTAPPPTLDPADSAQGGGARDSPAPRLSPQRRDHWDERIRNLGEQRRGGREARTAGVPVSARPCSASGPWHSLCLQGGSFL